MNEIPTHSSPNTAPDAETVYDVLIIGGGPAGATAAVYAARADRSTRVIDKGITAGALGMTSKISNFPGFVEPLTGSALVSTIRSQAESFGAVFVDDKITATKLDGEIKTLWGGKAAYRAKTVIIATGSMGRSQSIPGEEALTGRGVSYCATCDGFFFQDQTVAVAGNTDEAAEEALFLTRFARKVFLLVPTEDLRISDAFAQDLEAHPAVEVRRASRLTEILGESTVTGVRIAPLGDEPETLEVSGVFIYLQGGKPIIEFLGGQLPVTPEGCLAIDATFQTGMPGVFAAGDVLCKHLKQAVIASAEGASAAVAADRFLAGRAKLRPDWS